MGELDVVKSIFPLGWLMVVLINLVEREGAVTDFRAES